MNTPFTEITTNYSAGTTMAIASVLLLFF